MSGEEVVISGSGLWTPDHSITNEELVESYNAATASGLDITLFHFGLAAAEAQGLSFAALSLVFAPIIKSCETRAHD